MSVLILGCFYKKMSSISYLTVFEWKQVVSGSVLKFVLSVYFWSSEVFSRLKQCISLPALYLILSRALVLKIHKYYNYSSLLCLECFLLVQMSKFQGLFITKWMWIMLEFRDLESLAVLENRFFFNCSCKYKFFCRKSNRSYFLLPTFVVFLIKENQGHRMLSLWSTEGSDISLVWWDKIRSSSKRRTYTWLYVFLRCFFHELSDINWKLLTCCHISLEKHSTGILLVIPSPPL